MLAWMISTDIWGVCRGCSSVPLSRPSRPGAGIQGVPRTQHPRSGLSLPKPTGPLIPCQTDAFPISPAAGFPGRLRGASGLEQEVAPLAREKERVTWAVGRGGAGAVRWAGPPGGGAGGGFRGGKGSYFGGGEERAEARAARGDTPLSGERPAADKGRRGQVSPQPHPRQGRGGDWTTCDRRVPFPL